MKKIILIILMVGMAICCFHVPAGLAFSSRQNHMSEREKTLSCVSGMLRGMTFNPSYIQTTVGNFSWDDNTFFYNEKGGKITARLFLKKCHNRGVMVYYDSEKMAVSVSPVNF